MMRLAILPDRKTMTHIKMDVYLEHPIYKLIGEVADEMQMETYAVGGVVRDYFLQRPCSDIDVVCVGSGISLAEEVAKRIGPHTEVHVYRNFGTAQIHYNSDGIDWSL